MMIFFYKEWWKKRTWKRPEDADKPPYPNNEVICPNCGKPSGLERIFWMVIPPEGLKCKNCGHVIIKGNRYWC